VWDQWMGGVEMEDDVVDAVGGKVVELLVFFFQAEDGIRDWSVTGVQTCALPICDGQTEHEYDEGQRRSPRAGRAVLAREARLVKIGRASCRERVEIAVGAGSLKQEKPGEGKWGTGGAEAEGTGVVARVSACVSTL